MIVFFPRPVKFRSIVLLSKIQIISETGSILQAIDHQGSNNEVLLVKIFKNFELSFSKSKSKKKIPLNLYTWIT